MKFLQEATLICHGDLYSVRYRVYRKAGLVFSLLKKITNKTYIFLLPLVFSAFMIKKPGLIFNPGCTVNLCSTVVALFLR